MVPKVASSMGYAGKMEIRHSLKNARIWRHFATGAPVRTHCAGIAALSTHVHTKWSLKLHIPLVTLGKWKFDILSEMPASGDISPQGHPCTHIA